MTYPFVFSFMDYGANLSLFDTNHAMHESKKRELERLDALALFGARVDDRVDLIGGRESPLGLFSRRKEFANLPFYAQKDSFCKEVRRMWEETRWPYQNPFARWEAFEKNYRKVFVSDPTNPLYTAHWGMTQILRSRFNCYSSGQPKPWIGTYLSSFTVRHVWKMFYHPAECLPLEYVFAKADEDRKSGKIKFDLADILLHEATIVQHRGRYTQARDFNCEQSETLTNVPLFTTRKGPIFLLARQLSIADRQTGSGTAKGYGLKEVGSGEKEVFPNVYLPYKSYDRIGCPQQALSKHPPPFLTTNPEWVFRYSVNFHHPEVLEWWAEQIANELQKRAEEVHLLSNGQASLQFLMLDNVTSSSGLVKFDVKEFSDFDCSKSVRPPSDVLSSFKDTDRYHIQFIPTPVQFQRFFFFLRQSLNQKSEKHSFLQKVLKNIRLLPNVPGNPQQIESMGYSPYVDGYFSEGFFEPSWELTKAKDNIEILNSWIQKGKWFFPYHKINCPPPKTPSTADFRSIELSEQLSRAAHIRAMLGTHKLVPFPNLQPPPSEPRAPCVSRPSSVHQGLHPSPSGESTFLPGEGRTPKSLPLCNPSIQDHPPPPIALPSYGQDGLFFLPFAQNTQSSNSRAPEFWKSLLLRLGPLLSSPHWEEHATGASLNSEKVLQSLWIGEFQNGKLILSFFQPSCLIDRCKPNSITLQGPRTLSVLCQQLLPYGSHASPPHGVLHPQSFRFVPRWISFTPPAFPRTCRPFSP